MSFRTLKVEDLKEVADFFVVEVEAADAETGPTKKELLAALASGEEPVTWEQYNDIYLKAKAENLVVAPEVEEAPDLTAEPVVVVAEPVDTSDYILVKMERQNPRFDIRGYTFTKGHPFATMPPKDAEYVVRNVEGFRLAMPSEVADYYN